MIQRKEVGCSKDIAEKNAAKRLIIGGGDSLMHGAVTMSRAGRKRKMGKRNGSGHLVREYVNYRDMAALQPHRRDLPSKVRLSQEAVTSLGRLHLCGEITEPQYLAGEEYNRRVAAYRAIINGPRSMMVSSRWPGCNPDLCRIDVAECECSRRERAYQELYEVLNDKNAGCGHRVAMVVNNVVVHNQELGAFELNLLSIGLTALARHLHLSERGGR